MGARLFRIIFCVLFTVILLVTNAIAAPTAPVKERKNILYLNSYHNGYEWSDNLLMGFKKRIEDSPYSIMLQVEYLDSKKFPYKQAIQHVMELFQRKFSDTPFDLIAVSDNDAFNFIIKYGEELFPDVPVVFVGVNDFNPAKITGKQITGVTETFDVAANIRLALEMHPNLKQLIVIGDESVTGKAIRKQVVEGIPAIDKELKVQFWTDLPHKEIIHRVKQVSRDTFFYFIPMYREIDGQFYSAQELLQKVHDNTHAPLYSNWRFLLGHGILGGKLISGVTDGKLAAELGLKILNGTPASQLPVISQNTSPWAFDYNELKRLHISERALPEPANMINAPSRFYELNKQVFWVIIISLILLTITLVLLVMNILEKKSVEQKIKDQLSFLRLLMDTIPIPIYSKDKYGRYQQCNLAFEKFFGIQRDDILNCNEWELQEFGLSQLQHPVDHQLLLEPNESIYEQTISSREGSVHNILLHKATNVNARGEIAGMVGVIFDFSDRKKAEDRLRFAEEKYRSIFENSPLGIFRVRPTGAFVDVNPAFARMNGYTSPADFMAHENNALEDLLHDVDFRKARANEILTFERTLLRPDNTKIAANLSVRVVRDRLNNIELLEGFSENVTTRKRAEKALRNSERMLQSVMDNIPQLVSWKSNNFTYMGSNRSFDQFFGVQHARELIGKTDTEFLFNKQDADAMQHADSLVLTHNLPQLKSKERITDKEGHLVWLEINRLPLHGDKGEIVGLLTTAEDITQRINLERQLLQSQKMEAIGTLAGGIAHDFNNILTSIINSVELALIDIDEETLTSKDLERALRAAHHGSGLVKKILTFSKPSVAGFRAINILEIMNESVGLISASLPRNINVETTYNVHDAHTFGDPTQMNQVMMNICTNSFQALREHGGTLRLSVDAEYLTEEKASQFTIPEGEYFKLVIEDNGPGITSEIQDKIFDPFFTTKGKTEGTGLGLSVVLGIITGHGGGVEVSSIPFERTAFTIYLPHIDKPVLSAEEQHVESILQGEGRILFVEDDPDQLKTIPRVLRKLGYEVDPIGDAALAADMISEQPESWDLVITDFDMPELNGLELAQHISDTAPELPVIMVSGRNLAAKGAQEVPSVKTLVSKPYNSSIIGKAITSVLHPLQ